MRTTVDHPTLFDQPPPPYRGEAPYVAKSRTSRAAAHRATPKRLSWREKVYLALVAAGERGMTRPELAELLAISENTVRPRVCELLHGNDGRVVAAPWLNRDRCEVLLTREAFAALNGGQDQVCYAGGAQ